MQLSIPKGTYVVAVSGGVDSVALLHLLNEQRKTSGSKIIVAHFDHGIRKDSKKDRVLVGNLAQKYDLPFYYAEGKLGASASEELARDNRYEFLWKVVKENKASGLITAHHQDDLIESAIINVIRGTGRRGLSSIVNSKIERPLLGYSKEKVIEYAKKNSLTWNEDSTNDDPKYLRNYIRQNLIPKLSKTDKQKIVGIIKKQADLNKAIDDGLDKLLCNNIAGNKLPRLWFNSLDIKSSNEVVAFWLRQNGLGSYGKTDINRLTANLKTTSANKKIDVFSGVIIQVSKDFLALKGLER